MKTKIFDIIVPVGAWHFNEGNGNYCADTSAYRSEAPSDCYTRNTTWTNGAVGSALFFNGADSYAALSNLTYAYQLDSEVLNSHIQAITVAAWVKTSSTNSGAIIDFDADNYWSLGINVGGLSGAGHVSWITQGQSGGNHVCTSAMIVNDNAWHYVVATYDSATGSKKIFIDGIPDVSTNAYPGGEQLGSGTQQRYGFIGVRSSASGFDGAKNGNYFNGTIDEVRIDPYAWSASDIAERANLIVGKWMCSEGTGKLITNYVDAKNPAVLLEAYGTQSILSEQYQVQSSWVTNDGFNALLFNGTNMVVCHNDSDLLLTDDATISFWIKPTLGSTMCPVKKRGTREFQITILADGSMWMEQGSESGYVDTELMPSGSITNDEWHHIAVVRDATNHILFTYYDGQNVRAVGYTSNLALQPEASSWPVVIGQGVIGNVNRVVIFAKKLTASEINDLYHTNLMTMSARSMFSASIEHSEEKIVLSVSIDVNKHSLNLSWPVTSPGYTLQMTTSLSEPWSDGPPAIIVNGIYQVTADTTSNVQQFYRLVSK
jgi:hypothetical protein